MDNQQKFKVVGVAVDNYKVKKFKKTFISEGFEIIKVVKMNAEIKVIHVNCPVDKLVELGLKIRSLEALYQRKN